MNYAGINYHKRYPVVCIINATGNIWWKGKRGPSGILGIYSNIFRGINTIPIHH